MKLFGDIIKSILILAALTLVCVEVYRLGIETVNLVKNVKLNLSPTPRTVEVDLKKTNRDLDLLTNENATPADLKRIARQSDAFGVVCSQTNQSKQSTKTHARPK